MTEAVSYEFVAHSFVGKIRRVPWPYCTRCGTLRLNNPLTDAAVRLGCDAEYHPSWPRLRNTLPNEHRRTG